MEKVEVDLCIQGRVRLACDARNPIPRGYLKPQWTVVSPPAFDRDLIAWTD